MVNKYILFRKTRTLQDQVNTFLMNITQAGCLVFQALKHYLEKGADQKFLSLKNQVSSLEAENDTLRRQMELNLYHHMLLPDMRSDLIDLLEGCDKIINKYESDLILWSVEKPVIFKKLSNDLLHMTQTDLDCVGGLIGAVQSFFQGKNLDLEIQHTYQLEHQVDIQAIELKAKVFSDKKISLAHQLQLKDFIYSVEKISDMAEDVADKLKVIVAKHSL